MKKLFLTLAALTFAIGAHSASASLIIGDISQDIVHSGYSYTGGGISAAEAAFDAGSAACSSSLTSVNLVSPCRNRNYGQKISIELSNYGTTWFELGTDWGRGGIIYIENGSYVDVLGDIWWGYDWDDAFSFYLNGNYSGTLTLLGFEGCCGGATSLRYSTDGRDSWNIAAINVPEAGTLGLLFLGTLGLLLARRRNA